MKKKDWYQVDNLANVFLSTVTPRDTRTLRISCTLKEPIIPDVLYESLKETVTLLPQFHVQIHRGLFWHYIEEADTVPEIHEECRRICPLLYEVGDYSKPHYEVTYYKNRINFDLFHAISDGTGAIEFVNFLVFNYLKRLYPETVNNSIVPDIVPEKEKTEDSYKYYYEKETEAPKNSGNAFHPKSLKLPFDQLQFFEVHMPASEIIKRAKKTGVSVTSYISTTLIIAMINNMERPSSSKPITLALPVNLRNYYPSKSLRNFFNNISLTYQPTGTETFDEVAHAFDKMLKDELVPEKIKAHMNHFQKLQQNFGIRIAPLFIKQPGLRLAVWADNKNVSSVVSNLGSIKLPKEMGEHVDYYSLFCSSQNMFFCCNTFKDNMVIGITNPYARTDVIRDFVRGFSKDGVPVRLYSSEVVK